VIQYDLSIANGLPETYERTTHQNHPYVYPKMNRNLWLLLPILRGDGLSALHCDHEK